MRPRIAQELHLLRRVYDEVEHVEQDGEDWFHLPAYPVPPSVWIGKNKMEQIPVAFLIKADYPAKEPYGFLTPKTIRLSGKEPKNTGNPPKPVPFTGEWLHFSWTVENWTPGVDADKGSNLVAWCRSFAIRLREGA